MARKRSIYSPLYTGTPSSASGQRIRISQPDYKPIQLLKRSAVNIPADNPNWFILHKMGPRRKKLGVDPTEARAISSAVVRGSLPERLVYKKLMDFGYVPGSDFDFQSSQWGGRLELGGLVADFLFYWLRLIIQVQSVYHDKFLQSLRDQEQRLILEDMGYSVEYISPEDYNSDAGLDNRIRQILGLNLGRGSGMGEASIPDYDDSSWDRIYAFIDRMIREAQEIGGILGND